MMYSGIDLHSNNSVIAVIDDADHVVAQKRLPNETSKIVSFLARWQDEMAGVVVESTYNWYWLVDGLQDAGFRVHLANTSAIKQYEGLKHSGDETDAQHLAHLLRLGILPTGTILPREHRAVRDLARKRMGVGAIMHGTCPRGGKHHGQAARRADDQQPDQAADQ
jgi:transposase